MATPCQARPLIEAMIVDSATPESAFAIARRHGWLAGLLIIVMLGWQFSVVYAVVGPRWTFHLAATAALCLLLVSPIAWLVLLCIYPRPMQYATLFGVMGLVILTPLPCFLQYSRESARRSECRNNLRQFGTSVQQRAVSHGAADDGATTSARQQLPQSSAISTEYYLDTGSLNEP